MELKGFTLKLSHVCVTVNNANKIVVTKLISHSIVSVLLVSYAAFKLRWNDRIYGLSTHGHHQVTNSCEGFSFLS